MRIAPIALAALALVGSAGCGQLDMTPEGDPSRVLVGEVSWGEATALPADATVTVRVVDATKVGMPPEVLGSQTIHNPGATPVAFRVEYRAEDEVLRHGLNVEVRVSWGGSIRYFNMNGHAVTLGNASDTHRITVNPVRP
ncbi:MAG TPA: YbaY family lipoprotein [Opitutaceae bacterium]